MRPKGEETAHMPHSLSTSDAVLTLFFPGWDTVENVVALMVWYGILEFNVPLDTV